MRRLICYPILFVAILSTYGCNAPSSRYTPTLAFSEENLLQTVEAMPTFTPPLELATERPSLSVELPAIWPTLIPTAARDVYLYRTLSGDTLVGITGRFGVDPEEIQFEDQASLEGYLPIGQFLTMPRHLGATTPAQRLLPDAEIVYSFLAADFDVAGFVQQAGGYLSEHNEIVEEEEELSGSQIIQRVSSELSVNPRLLLALLDYRSGWVFDHPLGAEGNRYPIGFRISDRQGLYEEIKIAATQLNLAYYGWREGSFSTLRFSDGETMRLDPTLNAGSVALLHLFAILSDSRSWGDELYSPYGFPVHHFNLFGDAWVRANQSGGHIPNDLEQPLLELPFYPGEGWSLTAGPHNAWNTGTPLGALDFSPITAAEPCEDSAIWVTASANGMVVRARDNAVALDLDGDGDEGSGWVILYYHIAEQDMIPEGVAMAVDQRIGHPSCEGGTATGTHVHVTRKYNGEWIPADGPAPFELSGWLAVAGERIYKGQLVKGEQVVTADPAGRAGSTIIR